MVSQIIRSSALNNIPIKKLQLKTIEIIKSCEICKSLELNNSFDGLCRKCSLYNTAYNRYYESNIPVEYWDLKMEKDFSGYEGLLNKYNELVLDIKQTYVNGYSICFAGSYGRGKSMASTAILKKAVLKNYTALYTMLSDMVNVLTQASNEEKFTAKKELCMVDFLVIDEVDDRFIASNAASDLYGRSLEMIFRSRSQNKLPTFICTNSPDWLDVFNGALKQSLDSLTNGFMTTFPVIGADFRKKCSE